MFDHDDLSDDLAQRLRAAAVLRRMAEIEFSDVRGKERPLYPNPALPAVRLVGQRSHSAE